MASVSWIILLAPLLAATLITLFGLRRGVLSAGISIAAVLTTFICSVVLFLNVDLSQGPVEGYVSWLELDPLHVEIGYRLDGLSLLMLLVVTGVGSLIHIFSFGYMREDQCLGRYYAGLSLFMFSMLGIVLSNNFIQMFIFWELVGLSSYLLIGFWFDKPSAADACKKAFLTNRLGDFGFLLGILLVWSAFGTLHFGELSTSSQNYNVAWNGMATLAGLLIFCGAMGKSAQFPLHVWLPDAMEGPTPVSALIHAATMVAAGVYMLCRVFFLFDVGALQVIAWIGGITSLLAALMAVQQNDIKRILAYSTLSQLGYMVMAVGLASPTAAMFHLTTHAFFKAMLFLGAGSVIYALHHEQDIWKMGGLTKRLPITYLTFLLGTLALSGVPPFSGFYSKDSILLAAYHGNFVLFVIALLVAVLTTFYMFRLIFVAFIGPAKGEASGHAHESPQVMTLPLLLLAIPSVLGGLVGIEAYLAHAFNDSSVHATPWYETIFAPFSHAPVAAFAGLGAVIVGFSLAYTSYRHTLSDPLPAKLGVFSNVMRNRFYFDEFYSLLIRVSHDAWATIVDWIDRWVIAGFGVRGVHGTTEFTGRALRLLQTGNVQTYAFLLLLGVVALLGYILRTA